MKVGLNFAVALGCLALAGCATNYAALPSGNAAYKTIPPIDQAPLPKDYIIGPGDQLSLSVFAEPDLSMDKLLVDQAGNIQVPLIGVVAAAGRTADRVGTLIGDRLGEKYLRNPKVTVNVAVPAEKLVTVEGQVAKAGVYPINPDTTLLSAVSMAQSPTRIASLKDTVLFRTINGQRIAARFDLNRIRAGIDPDPKIESGDVVVVGYSSTKAIYRDVISAAAFFNLLARSF